ncbi:hypothetical protein SALWKB12_1121 [Snodgrassella communis]|nr:hypothetical protein SALWKB12_1121 [Snodgrassella communis]
MSVLLTTDERGKQMSKLALLIKKLAAITGRKSCHLFLSNYAFRH